MLNHSIYFENKHYMAIEIERKFLVLSDAYKKEAFKVTFIKQGYLSSAPERSVRVRVKGDKAYLTVKGLSNDSGTSRFEWEKEITLPEAQDLFKLCEPGMIEKYRYEVHCADFVFEIDEFLGENEGLVMAEIELPDESAEFKKPQWLGHELTGDKRYYNSYLVANSFKNW